MIKKVAFSFVIIFFVLCCFRGLNKAPFLEDVKSQYPIIEDYTITLGSSNKRALFIEYIIDGSLDSKEVKECFEYTKDYAISYREKSKKASNVKEIYIRFIDSNHNLLEYSSFYNALGHTIYYLDHEHMNKVDNFSTWYEHREYVGYEKE